MNTEDLNRLVDSVGTKLPENYRRFMVNYPQELIDIKLNLGWKREPISARFFRNDLASLLYYNEDVRRPGTPWTEVDGPWPQRYFVIGDDQCGNYYVIDLESNSQEVWFYDHELGSFQRAHETLEAFAHDLIRETLDFNQKYHSEE